MQWVTIMTYCFEDEAASGKAEAAVANREPVSQRRRRRGALPNANATSVTQPAARAVHASHRADCEVHGAAGELEGRVAVERLGGKTSMQWVSPVTYC